MVDTTDLKSVDHIGRKGSSPFAPIFFSHIVNIKTVIYIKRLHLYHGESLSVIYFLVFNLY